MLFLLDLLDLAAVGGGGGGGGGGIFIYSFEIEAFQIEEF